MPFIRDKFFFLIKRTKKKGRSAQQSKLRHDGVVMPMACLPNPPMNLEKRSNKARWYHTSHEIKKKANRTVSQPYKKKKVLDPLES